MKIVENSFNLLFWSFILTLISSLRPYSIIRMCIKFDYITPGILTIAHFIRLSLMNSPNLWSLFTSIIHYFLCAILDIRVSEAHVKNWSLPVVKWDFSILSLWVDELKEFNSYSIRCTKVNKFHLLELSSKYIF